MALSESLGVKVLVVGESWIKHTVHMKGFDQFHTTEYEEGGWAFLDGLAESGFDVTYVRAHEISMRFPDEPATLAEFDVVVLSDIGANSFLLTDEVFLRSERSVNRLAMLRDYVKSGGGLVMVGGYMSFSGIDGRARFGMSPLASVLPVHMLDHDDRVEVPEGVKPTVEQAEHPVLGGAPADWPQLLGYNRLVAKAGSTVIVSVEQDPLLVIGETGQGRAVAFASDFAPHWAPPDFVQWPHYSRLWAAIVAWAARDGERGARRRQETMKAEL
ncbi:MAG: glutamine amidotransferase [Solirubrobacteraceae bacterium]